MEWFDKPVTRAKQFWPIRFIFTLLKPSNRARKRVEHTEGSQSATRCQTSPMYVYLDPALDKELHTLTSCFLYSKTKTNWQLRAELKPLSTMPNFHIRAVFFVMDV